MDTNLMLAELAHPLPDQNERIELALLQTAATVYSSTQTINESLAVDIATTLLTCVQKKLRSVSKPAKAR